MTLSNDSVRKTRIWVRWAVASGTAASVAIAVDRLVGVDVHSESLFTSGQGTFFIAGLEIVLLVSALMRRTLDSDLLSEGLAFAAAVGLSTLEVFDLASGGLSLLYLPAVILAWYAWKAMSPAGLRHRSGASEGRTPENRLEEPDRLAVRTQNVSERLRNRGALWAALGIGWTAVALILDILVRRPLLGDSTFDVDVGFAALIGPGAVATLIGSILHTPGLRVTGRWLSLAGAVSGTASLVGLTAAFGLYPWIFVPTVIVDWYAWWLAGRVCQPRSENPQIATV